MRPLAATASPLLCLFAAMGCGSPGAPGALPAPAVGRYEFTGVLFEGNTRLTIAGRLTITSDTVVMEVPGADCRQYESDGDRVEIFCVTTEVNVVTRQRTGFRFVWHRGEPARDAGAAVIRRVDGRQRYCPPEPLLNDCYMEALALSTSTRIPLTVTPVKPMGKPASEMTLR